VLCLVMGASSRPVMFLPCSGVLNGAASLLASFPKVSESIATDLKFSVPREVHALEQGLLFVAPSSPFVQACVMCYLNRCKPCSRACTSGLSVNPSSPYVQGTLFAAPTAQYAMAASPDALLVGDGGFKALLKMKCACPYTEKDDGRGWV